MRIVQLNTFCGVKSTGRIAGEIARLVEADGGECLIGYGVPGISEDSERFALKIGTSLERKIHAVMRKLFDAEGYGSYFATKKLISQLKVFQPDLIHMHNLHGCYLNLELLFRFLAKTNIPVVWTLHDCWPFTGHCAYFDFCGCEKWKRECCSCPQQKSYPICIGLDGSSRNYHHKKKLFTKLQNLTFVAPCEWMTTPLRQSFMGKYPVRVIVNGVNLNAFHPFPSDLRERYGLLGKKVCLSVASEWDERKGLRYICAAAKKMGNEYTFVVIGLEDEQMNDLPSNVLGLKRTSSTDELAQWYSTADCLVNPTLEDNMPMVNLEALACGTPVAVFRTGGCPEAVDESCGCVVDQGDTKSLCRAIEWLCSNKPAMGESCLKRARLFDCQATFQAYLSLYKELCS